MKTKTMLTTVILTTGLAFGAVSIPTSAASWHHGVPKILRHTKWHLAGHHKDRLTFSKNHFSFWGPTGGARSGLPENQVRYKAIHHHYYLFHARDRDNAFNGRYFKYVNKHTLIEYPDPSGYTYGKKSIWHRYY